MKVQAKRKIIVKSALPVFIVVLLLGLCVPFLSFTNISVASANLCVSPEAWTTSYTGMYYGIGGVTNVVLDESVTYLGEASVRIDPSSGGINTGREANSFYTSVSPGDTIKFSGWIKTDESTLGDTDPNSGGRIGIDYYGSNGRIGATQSPDGDPSWVPPGVWDDKTYLNYVNWGSDWTQVIMEFTVPDTIPADPWCASGYSSGSYYEPSAIIPWLQVWSSTYGAADGGSVYFANTELYINGEEIPLSTVSSTELINYSGFTSQNIADFTAYCVAQGITEVTLRLPAYSDFVDGELDSGWETVTLSIISALHAEGISVNIDLHTWYTTWDNYFDDAVSGTDELTYRTLYYAYETDVVNTFKNVAGVKAFHVMNEPQWQYASAAENNFIITVADTAQALTDLPIGIRFMAGASPWESSHHYWANISDHIDLYCINSYWNPLNPDKDVNNSGEQDILDTLEQAHADGKEMWVTEFGSSSTNEETQRAYVEAWVTYANSATDTDGVAKDVIDRIFCWASSPTQTESYNIWNTADFTPKDAFYELLNVVTTYIITNSIVSPLNTTYVSSTVPFGLFVVAGNDTVLSYQINAYYSNGTAVGVNQTSSTGSFAGLADGIYKFAVYVVGEQGSTDYDEVWFTVDTSSEPDIVDEIYMSVTVSPNIYFMFSDGVYLNFEDEQTFSINPYRIDDIWYFESNAINLIGANATVTKYFESNVLEFTLTGDVGVNSAFTIDTGSYGSPVEVSGASSWSFDTPSNTLTVLRSHSVDSAYTVSVSFVQSVIIVDLFGDGDIDLLLQYLLAGDLLGFIVACYTTRIGQVFYALIALIITVPLAIRTQSITYVAIIWILLGGLFQAAMPVISPVAVFLIILGVGSLLYRLFAGRHE